MKASKTFILLCLICVIGLGVVVAKFLPSSPANTAKPTATAPSGSGTGGGTGGEKPGTAIRTTKKLKLDKSANVIPDLDKEALTRDLTPKEALESKFRNWRDDGRKQFEEIFQGDRERTGLVMRTLFQNEQFRAMFQQSRELEAKWPKASEEEKAAIMSQMEGIRTKGLGLVRSEAARLAAGGAPQTSDNGPVQIQTFGGASVVTPGQAAPVQTQAPAAPAVAPVIIM
jgi:hypothetical protein